MARYNSNSPFKTTYMKTKMKTKFKTVSQTHKVINRYKQSKPKRNSKWKRFKTSIKKIFRKKTKRIKPTTPVSENNITKDRERGIQNTSRTPKLQLGSVKTQRRSMWNKWKRFKTKFRSKPKSNPKYIHKTIQQQNNIKTKQISKNNARRFKIQMNNPNNVQLFSNSPLFKTKQN